MKKGDLVLCVKGAEGIKKGEYYEVAGVGLYYNMIKVYIDYSDRFYGSNITCWYNKDCFMEL